MKIFFSKRTDNNSGNDLLLFFNGWGMDETPFMSLLPEKIDCLIVSNYKADEDEKLLEYLAHYQKIDLLSWSMGVWYGQMFFLKHAEQRQKIGLALAINGTLNPIDDTYGISPELFESMSSDYSVEVRDRFYRQMCGRELQKFMDNKPERDLDNQQDELIRLISTVKAINVEESIYHNVLISSKDFIVPTKSQKRFWQNNDPIVMKGSHFPFYGWNDLSTGIQTVRGSGC